MKTCFANDPFASAGFWHYLVYVSPVAHGNLKEHKYNKQNQVCWLGDVA
jgi:hypothetical protein